MQGLMRTFAVMALGCLWMTPRPLFAPEPELSLSEAIQIALMNNRPAKIAQLDITKADWQVASTKTKRFPAISTYFFGSGNLTSPTFTFNKGVLGTLDNKPNPS